MKTNNNLKLEILKVKASVKSLNLVDLKGLNGGRKAVVNTGGGGGIDD